MRGEKEIIRDQMKAWRQRADPTELEQSGKLINEKLIKLIDWSEINSLHTYIPIPSLREVNTWSILSHVWNNYPSVITAIASAHNNGKDMALRVGPANKWRGIYPESRRPMSPGFKFDVIIVPTLAYDEAGNRLGYGGGYYDRFLANQPQALKIGLAYSGSLVKSGLPAEMHDVRLDKIINEL